MGSDSRNDLPGAGRVAFVTGASRGIGKAIALQLSMAGFDVAIGARSIHEGEQREYSSTVNSSNVRSIPGSLDSTADLIARSGGRALAVYLDLLDRASIESAVLTVTDRWGHIDVLVNNGRYVGPGVMDLFADTSIALLERNLEANVIAPVALTKLVLPGMLERKRGHIVNLASAAGTKNPTEAVGGGVGWGVGYAMSKAAFGRLAGILAVEHGHQGITAFNVHPGHTVTERISLERGQNGFNDPRWAPPDVVGAVIAWLVTATEAQGLSGQWIEAQEICRQRGLIPEWQDKTISPLR